jgi:hypothetical protein
MESAGLRKVPGQAEDNGRAMKCSLRHAISERWWYFTWSIGERRDRILLVLGEKRGFANKCDVQPNLLTYKATGWTSDLLSVP